MRRTLVVLFILAGMPVVAAAETQQVAELREQIADLQAQIDQIKQQNTAELGGIRLTRNLSLGDRGPEVRSLQRFLNSRDGISVAQSGAGSPGSETAYFGAKTKQAVTAFQRRHAGDVLTPAGAAHPTGYVGLQTRRKINTIAAQQAQNGDAHPSGENNGGAAAADKTPTIESITPSTGADGTQITIHGEHLNARENTVEMSLVRPKDYPTVASPDGETLIVTIETYVAQAMRERLPSYSGSMELSEINERYSEDFPRHFDVKIRVENSDGVSNTKTFELTSI